MSTKQLFHIHLSSELWDEATVAGLNRAGHTVTLLNEDVVPEGVMHLYVGHRAWRVPTDITKASIEAHMDTILKQAKVLLHGDIKVSDAKTGDPKPKAKRKAKPKTKPTAEFTAVLQGGDMT